MSYTQIMVSIRVGGELRPGEIDRMRQVIYDAARLAEPLADIVVTEFSHCSPPPDIYIYQEDGNDKQSPYVGPSLDP